MVGRREAVVSISIRYPFNFHFQPEYPLTYGRRSAWPGRGRNEPQMDADARGGAKIPRDTSRKPGQFFLSPRKTEALKKSEKSDPPPPETEALQTRVMPHSRAARALVAYTVSSSCRPVPAENAETAPLCLCVLVVAIPSASTSQPPRHQDTKRPGLLHPRLRPYKPGQKGLDRSQCL